MSQGVSQVSGRIPAEVGLPLGLLLHADSWIRAKLRSTEWLRSLLRSMIGSKLGTPSRNTQIVKNLYHVTQPRDVFCQEVVKLAPSCNPSKFVADEE